MDSSVHRRTPSLTVNESRGLPIRQIEYLRKVAAGLVETLITRQHYDAAGRLLEQSDPRLFGVVPNLTTVYRLNGEPLKVSSVDAGWRLPTPFLSPVSMGSIFKVWIRKRIKSPACCTVS